MMLDDYGLLVQQLIKTVNATQMPQLARMATEFLPRLQRGGRIWFFGSGHSHIAVEDFQEAEEALAFMRTFNPPELYDHPLKSGPIERDARFAEVFLEQMELLPDDICWFISNSGTNGNIVEMSRRVKEMGCLLVAQCNMKQSSTVSPRHPSGMKMYEIADWIVDNCGADGDAGFTVIDGQPPMGATSNIVGTYLMQAMRTALLAALQQCNCTDQTVTHADLAKLDSGSIQVVLDEYTALYQQQLEAICAVELVTIDKAAKLSAEAVRDDHRSACIGIGHDHSLVEEIHSRAGTIMCNKSLVIGRPEITLYYGLRKAVALGKSAAYGETILAQFQAQAKDSVLIISQTADQPALQTFAEGVKAAGGHILLVFNGQLASPEAGLLAVADLCIDNHAGKMVTTSQGFSCVFTTSLSSFIMQCYGMAMASHLHQFGIDLPIRISINTDRGLPYTEELNRKYFKDTIL